MRDLAKKRSEIEDDYNQPAAEVTISKFSEDLAVNLRRKECRKWKNSSL